MDKTLKFIGKLIELTLSDRLKWSQDYINDYNNFYVIYKNKTIYIEKHRECYKLSIGSNTGTCLFFKYYFPLYTEKERQKLKGLYQCIEDNFFLFVDDFIDEILKEK